MNQVYEIKIPSAISIDGKSISIYSFIQGVVNDPKFCKNYYTLDHRRKVLSATEFAKTHAADKIILGQEPFNLLKDCCAFPTQGYNQQAAEFLPFMDAIVLAELIAPQQVQTKPIEIKKSEK